MTSTKRETCRRVRRLAGGGAAGAVEPRGWQPATAVAAADLVTSGHPFILRGVTLAGETTGRLVVIPG